MAAPEYSNADQAAYPVSAEVERAVGQDGRGSIGLTKREAFAMAAMQGLLANPYYAQEMADGQCSGSPARSAVYHADELLRELQAPTP